jgi:nitrate reductase beta subunit
MQVGFVIDHRKCIGCHACTVACKAENDVPLGNFRTWVKYVEKGTFPDVRRHFTVLRCNHCDRAPCVEICPVNALQKRPDAIVDLDRDYLHRLPFVHAGLPVRRAVLPCRERCRREVPLLRASRRARTRARLRHRLSGGGDRFRVMSPTRDRESPS